ncbi:MAG: primosomal protein N' [Alphaproteobacteria bacterium]
MPYQNTSSRQDPDTEIATDYPPGAMVAVQLPLAVGGAYDYRLPVDAGVYAGAFVLVPLGRRQEVGVVWGPASGGLPESRIRPVTDILSVPPLPEVVRRFVDWVAAYTLHPRGTVLRMAMSVGSVFSGQPPPPRAGYHLGEAAIPADSVRVSAQRRKVLEAAGRSPGLPASELARAAGVTAGVVRGLAAAGLLRAVPLDSGARFGLPDPRRPGPVLSPSQAAAATHLTSRVAEGGFGVTLLHGVTGSGKTEVYFEAMAGVLEQGRQALVLLPEIALTAQWLDRFAARFGTRPAPWHSELGDAARRDTWRGVAEGRARVVVGARSALFLPFPDLGLIVVDEEHESAFKQEDGVAYHARDMAVVRARLGEHPVVLASATPSLETLTNVERGRYHRVHLPDRHGGASMPTVSVIDMRREPPEKGSWGPSWLSPPLVAEVSSTLASGEQAMLFLNRRGYAPLTLCRNCGHRLHCPNCSAWLVEHRTTGLLQCHHCAHAIRLPRACPSCSAEDRFAACGPGVERVAEEAAARFATARIAVMTSDTLSGPAAAESLVRRVMAHQVDLLIGTQIMAKGYHFPLLTLVGVVDADLGLGGGDLRAAERTLQLLGQVSGRAGRADRPGRVLVQSHDPTHPVIAALVDGDPEAFYAVETEQRRLARMPPFGRLVGLIVSGSEAARVDQAAAELARTAPRGAGVLVLGPAPAPLAYLRGRHRRRLLLKTDLEVRVQPLLRAWLAMVKPAAGVRVQVDVDPYSFN